MPALCLTSDFVVEVLHCAGGESVPVVKTSPARTVLVWALALAAVVAVPGVARAENPADIQSELADDGVYIAPSRSAEIDAGVVLPTIERARTRGVTMQIAWPEEPQPNTSAFARRLQEFNGVDVVLVFGPDGELGSFVSEDYEDGAVRAINAARLAGGPRAQADAFLTGLLEEPVRERPAIINTMVRWIALLVGALVIGAVGEQMIRQYRRGRQKRQLEELESRQESVSD